VPEIIQFGFSCRFLRSETARFNLGCMGDLKSVSRLLVDTARTADFAVFHPGRQTTDTVRVCLRTVRLQSTEVWTRLSITQTLPALLVTS